MKVVADVTMYPIGVGVSLSRYVAACQQVLEDAGLNTHLHACGTNVEGEWDEVMAAIKRCHEVLHEMGTPRVASAVKLGTRVDKQPSMAGRVASVEAKLGS